MFVLFPVRDILRYIQEHRDGVELMYKYYTVPVPLCYTQVVSLAVYGYFFFGLFTNYDPHYVPISLFVRFLVYFGWLKVAESLICPYGDSDDNDFDMVYMLHRNLQVNYMKSLEVFDYFSSEFSSYFDKKC